MSSPISSSLRTALFTLLHLLVDCACIFFMFAVIAPMAPPDGSFLFLVITYNAAAFALPVLVGLLSDVIRRNNYLAAAGCLLVAGGYFLRVSPFWMAVVIGMGNGLYHVGSGRQVLQDAHDRYAPPGIFIASGAIGLFIGRTLAARFLPVWYVFMGLLTAAALLLIGLGTAEPRFNRENEEKTRLAVLPGRSAILSVVLLAFVVLLRSYYGTILQYDWNTGFLVPLFFTLSIAAGKGAGGILADRIGLRNTVILSLGAAAFLALFSFRSPLCGCLSILFFNMTMPLTLSRMAEIWRPYPGFAFGFLMLFLFLGLLPTQIFGLRWLLSPVGLAVLCLLSMALLLIDCRRIDTPVCHDC